VENGDEDRNTQDPEQELRQEGTGKEVGDREHSDAQEYGQDDDADSQKIEQDQGGKEENTPLPLPLLDLVEIARSLSVHAGFWAIVSKTPGSVKCDCTGSPAVL
jgi:hypothetical protein